MKMKKFNKTGEIMLENLEVYWEKLDAPDTSAEGKDRYNLTIFGRKDDTEFMAQIKELNLELTNLLKKRKLNYSSRKNNPVKDGDTTYLEKKMEIDADLNLDDTEKETKIKAKEYYRNKYHIKFISKNPVRIVDAARNPIQPTDVVWSQAKVNVLFSPWVYSKQHVGISLYMSAIQVVEQGTAGGFETTEIEDAFAMVGEPLNKVVNPLVTDEDPDSIFSNYADSKVS